MIRLRSYKVGNVSQDFDDADIEIIANLMRIAPEELEWALEQQARCETDEYVAYIAA